MTNAKPVVTFVKGASAPFLRLVLEDKSQLMIQYMHIHSVTLSESETVLLIVYDGLRVQIEGQKLSSLLLNLQTYQVSSIQAGSDDELKITRVVSIPESVIE
jgi:hypothetical protein